MSIYDDDPSSIFRAEKLNHGVSLEYLQEMINRPINQRIIYEKWLKEYLADARNPAGV
jgi:hypothetical protein